MSKAKTDTWFKSANPAQRSTLESLRKLIRTAAPEAIEEIKWSRPCYSNANGMYCYLHSTQSHATLGFANGALLKDPEGLLEGTGKLMRHIKFKEGSALPRSAVTALLKQAATFRPGD